MQARGEDEAVGTLDGLVLGADGDEAAGQGVAQLAVAADFIGRAKLVKARVPVLVQEVVADARARVHAAANPDLQPGGQWNHRGVAAGFGAGLDAEAKHDAQGSRVRERQAVVEFDIKLGAAACGFRRAAGRNEYAGGDGVRAAEDRQGWARRGIGGGGSQSKSAESGAVGYEFQSRCSFFGSDMRISPHPRYFVPTPAPASGRGVRLEEEAK
jgi:hypothetical protein